MLDRVGTLGQSNRNLSNILMQQARADDLLGKISSGKNARQYQGLAPRAGLLINLENELERFTQYSDTVATVERRSTKQETDIKSIVELLGEFRKQLLSAANDENYKSVPLGVIGENFYDQVANLLNTQQDGRHIWGGSDTNTQPVLTFDEVTDAIEARIDGREASDVLTALRDVETIDPMTGMNRTAMEMAAQVGMVAGTFLPPPVPGGSPTEQVAANAAQAAAAEAAALPGAGGESTKEAAIAAAQRAIGGIVLFADNVAPKDLVDPDSGLPVRAQQLVDFLTGDRSFGTQGDPDKALENNPDSPDGLLQKFKADPKVDPQLRLFINQPANEAPNYREWQTSTASFRFSDIYYQGNTDVLQARIEDGVEIDYNLTADRAGIEQVLTAAWLIGDDGQTDFSGSGEGVPDVKARIDAALHLLEDALGISNRDNLPNADNLTAIRSEAGFTLKRLAEGKQRIDQFELTTGETVSSIENTDIQRVVAQLADNQSFLNASYRAIAALRDLSLANFLR